MCLGVGAYKVGGVALAWGGGIHGNPASGPTRHHHTEQFSEILTDQCLPSHYLKTRGREGKKWHANSKPLQQHFAKNYKQATVYIRHKVPLLEASGHSSIAGKTADQHCFKINFA